MAVWRPRKERRMAARLKNQTPSHSPCLSLFPPHTTNRKVAIPVPQSMQWDEFVTEVSERESVANGRRIVKHTFFCSPALSPSLLQVAARLKISSVGDLVMAAVSVGGGVVAWNASPFFPHRANPLLLLSPRPAPASPPWTHCKTSTNCTSWTWALPPPRPTRRPCWAAPARLAVPATASRPPTPRSRPRMVRMRLPLTWAAAGATMTTNMAPAPEPPHARWRASSPPSCPLHPCP